MVHVATLNSARFEDTHINGGPSLKLDGLFMKAPPSASTPRRLPDAIPNLHPHHETHRDHLPYGIEETDDEHRHHWFVGSIDQGTTSSRFLIFNGEGEPIASHQIEFENLYPKSGYVQHHAHSWLPGCRAAAPAPQHPHLTCGATARITDWQG
jgi:glycerol kinase